MPTFNSGAETAPGLRIVHCVDDIHPIEETSPSAGAFYGALQVPCSRLRAGWSNSRQGQPTRTVNIGGQGLNNEVDPNRIFTRELLDDHNRDPKFLTPRAKELLQQARLLLEQAAGGLLVVSAHRDNPVDFDPGEVGLLQRREQEGLKVAFPGSVPGHFKPGITQSHAHVFLETRDPDELKKIFPGLYESEFARGSKEDPLRRLVRLLWERFSRGIPHRMPSAAEYLHYTDPSLPADGYSFPAPGLIVGNSTELDGTFEKAALAAVPLTLCVELPVQSLREDKQMRRNFAEIVINRLASILKRTQVHNPLVNAL